MFVLLAFLTSCSEFDLSQGDIVISEYSDTQWQVSQRNKQHVIPKSVSLEITGRASNSITFDSRSNSVLLLNLERLTVDDAAQPFLNLNGMAKISTKSKTANVNSGVFGLDHEELIDLLENATTLSESPTPTEEDEGLSKTAIALAVALPLCIIIAFIIGFLLGLWCSRRQIIHHGEPLQIRDHYSQPMNDRPIFQEFQR